MTTTQKAISTLTDEEMILRKRALKRMNELKYTIQQKILPKVKTSLEKHLRETYNIADVNGDGNLSYEEFADWLGNGPTGLNVGFTKDDIRDITLACDADLDGGISVDEFIDFVTRKNKLDPRSFLNDKRQEKVNYMRSLRRRTLKNMRKKVDHGNTARTVDTDHSTDDKLSTRLWYEDSNSTQDGDVYANEAKRVEVEKIQGSDMSGACKTTDISRRLGRTIEADLERHMEESTNIGCVFTPRGMQNLSMSVKTSKIRETIALFQKKKYEKVIFISYTFSQISHLETRQVQK